MSATVRDIITAVQHELGEVAGAGVQVYSEDRIRTHVEQCFEIVFIKHAWDEYCTWIQAELDELNGIFTTDAMSSVRSMQDVVTVIREEDNHPIPKLAPNINPFKITGSKAKNWSGLPHTSAWYSGRLLQFWPKTAAGTVNIRARIHPGTIVPDTTLYLDKELMIYGTAWKYLSVEGINPSGTQTMLELFDLRYRDIMHALANHPVDTGSMQDYPNEWYIDPR